MTHKDPEKVHLHHLRTRFERKELRNYYLNLRKGATQVYIRIDMSQLMVAVEVQFKSCFSRITVFYAAPSLAEAVISARKFCRRYYSDISVLEYNVQ